MTTDPGLEVLKARVAAAALGPDEAWGLSTNRVLAASERYRATEILVGRIAVLASGEIAGDWAYLSGSGRQDRGVGKQTAERHSVTVREPCRQPLETAGDRSGERCPPGTEVNDHASCHEFTTNRLAIGLVGQHDGDGVGIQRRLGGHLLLEKPVRHCHGGIERPRLDANRTE